MTSRFTRIAAIGAASICTMMAGRTQAANADCRDTSQFPNPIYIAGSSAIKPFIIEMAKALSNGENPTTLIYASKGSCVGVNAIALGEQLAASTLTAYTKDAPNGVSCDIATAQTVDIGVSDVFVESCADTPERPADVGDFLGPVQAMAFIAPSTNTAQAILAEEGHFVFGWDDSNGLATSWNDANFKFRRAIDSGTQIIIGGGIQVPTTKVKGIQTSGTGEMISKVGGATGDAAAKTIGFAGVADIEVSLKKTPPDPIKMLAFRALRQKHAFFPNSSATSFDRRNVRDGHYTLFGYAHLVAKISPSTGKPVDPKVAMLVDYVLGTATDAPFNLNDVAIKGGLVPQCAMTVTRTRDAGELQVYSPAASCACYFERNVPGNTDIPTACKTCTDSSECGGGVCRSNVCEAR